MQATFRRLYTLSMKLVMQNLEFIRYILTGVLNTIISAVIFYIFLFCGFEYWLAGLCTLIISVLNNFFNYRRLVFTKTVKSYFHRYCILHLTLYFANLSMRNYLSSVGLRDEIIYLILLPPTALFGYLCARYLVFKSIPAPVEK